MLYMICARISRSAVQHTDYQTTSEIEDAKELNFF